MPDQSERYSKKYFSSTVVQIIIQVSNIYYYNNVFLSLAETVCNRFEQKLVLDLSSLVCWDSKTILAVKSLMESDVARCLATKAFY